MAGYDQLGPKIQLVFDDDEYYIRHATEPDEERLMSHAWVFEASQTSPLEVMAEDYADIGHVALYCAYIHHTQRREVCFDYKNVEGWLDNSDDGESHVLPYMSPQEIDSRFEVIETDRALTTEEVSLITQTALEMVVRFNKPRKNDIIRKRIDF